MRRAFSVESRQTGGKVEAESWVEITIGAAEDACQDKASPEQVIAQLHEVNFDVVSHW